MAKDMFDLAAAIVEASAGLSVEQVEKAMKMAMVAIGDKEPTVAIGDKEPRQEGCRCESCQEWRHRLRTRDHGLSGGI
jgi:hypothetical protein